MTPISSTSSLQANEAGEPAEIRVFCNVSSTAAYFPAFDSIAVPLSEGIPRRNSKTLGEIRMDKHATESEQIFTRYAEHEVSQLH